MKIQQERLDKILELYKPNCRYLTEAFSDYPKASGRFKLGDTYYTTQRIEHMTSIEAQLCLNQLCYVAFSDWVTNGKFEDPMPFEIFQELTKESMFIIRSNIGFRKAIPTSKEIQAQIELIRVRKHGDLYLAFLDYNIENGKSRGNLELALKI